MKINLEALGVYADSSKIDNLSKQITALEAQNKQKDTEIQSLKQSAMSSSSSNSSYLSQINDLNMEIKKYKDLLARKDAEINSLINESSKLQESLKSKDARDLIVANNAQLELAQALKEVETLKEKNTELKADKVFFQTLLKEKSSSKSGSVKSKLYFFEEGNKKLEFSDIISKEQTVFSESLNNSISNINPVIVSPENLIENKVENLSNFSDCIEIKKPKPMQTEILIEESSVNVDILGNDLLN